MVKTLIAEATMVNLFLGNLSQSAALGYADQFGQLHRTYSSPKIASTAFTADPIPILKSRR